MAFIPGPTASQANGGRTGAFCPGWRHQPGQKDPLFSRLVPPTGTKGSGHLVPGGNTNPDKRTPFCPVWWLQPGLKGSFVPVGVSNRDKRPPSPPLARLAVGPGTKATYCPGPKDCRDKWPETNAYSVVVSSTASISPIKKTTSISTRLGTLSLLF